MEILQRIYERLLIEFKSYNSISSTVIYLHLNILQINIREHHYDLRLNNNNVLTLYYYHETNNHDRDDDYIDYINILNFNKDDDIELLFNYLKNVDTWKS